MRDHIATDHWIAALAVAQGGVVDHWQLRSIGLGSAAIGRRVVGGRLHRLHRGVYAVGHRRISEEGSWWAAVLACGPRTVLSHASAAAAWDLRRSSGATVDVTVGLAGRSSRPGIRLHRSRVLAPDETTTRSGLPITTPARTLLDLAASGLHGRQLEAALDRGELLRTIDFADLRRLLQRYPRRQGSPALIALLERYTAGATVTRSELEERFLALCDRSGLPRPSVNCVVNGREVDFFWRSSGLVVEVDGYAWHRSPSAFAADRERDVLLVLAGYRVLRFTWHDVTERPDYVAESLRRALLRPDLA